MYSGAYTGGAVIRNCLSYSDLLKIPSSVHLIGAYCKWRGLSTKDQISLHHFVLPAKYFKSGGKILFMPDPYGADLGIGSNHG